MTCAAAARLLAEDADYGLADLQYDGPLTVSQLADRLEVAPTAATRAGREPVSLGYP